MGRCCCSDMLSKLCSLHSSLLTVLDSLLLKLEVLNCSFVALKLQLLEQQRNLGVAIC
jgi:hypothetical protein